MGARVLVIGASGALGSQICAALDGAGLVVLRGVRARGHAAEVVLDIGERRSIERAVTGVDLVVVAVPHTDPLVQQVCARSAVPCVDVSPHAELRDRARSELGADGPPSIVMCGLYPGLSGILASQAAAELEEVGAIAVGLWQSTNANVGPAGVRDMLLSLCRPVPTATGTVPGFSRRRRMRFAAQTATVRLVRYDESEVLRERFTGSEVGYFTAWNSAVFTAALAVMAKLGLLSRLATSRADLTPTHDPRTPQTVHLRAEAYGTRDGRPSARALEVEAESDYGATALMVAAVARRLLDDPSGLRGVLTPMEVMSLEDLAPLLEGRQLRLSRYARP